MSSFDAPKIDELATPSPTSNQQAQWLEVPASHALGFLPATTSALCNEARQKKCAVITNALGSFFSIRLKNSSGTLPGNANRSLRSSGFVLSSTLWVYIQCRYLTTYSYVATYVGFGWVSRPISRPLKILLSSISWSKVRGRQS